MLVGLFQDRDPLEALGERGSMLPVFWRFDNFPFREQNATPELR